MERLTLAVLLVVACADVCAAGVQPNEPPADEGSQSGPGAGADVKEIRARLGKVTAQGDLRGIEQVVRELWAADSEAGLKAARQLLLSKDQRHPVIGAAVIGSLGFAAQIEATLRGLKASGQADERRWLVRALGTRAGEREAAARILEGYVNDRDKLVRTSAIHALVELGDARALVLIGKGIPGTAPALQGGSWHDDEDGPLEMAQYGAVRWLSGLRAENSRDVQRWLKENLPKGEPIDAPKQPDPRELPGEPAKVRGQEAYFTPSFDVYFRSEGASGPEQLAPGGGDGGESGWARMAPMFEQAASFAVTAATPIFGRVYPPNVRLYLADDKQFTSLADAPTSFAGSSKGNEVVLRYNSLPAMVSVLAHEYVHVVHQASYPEQPRWLAEGLAESLTRSTRGPAWTPALAEEMGIARDVTKGLFSEVLAWKTSGTTGEREGQLYAMSWLAVDYLRFGPFGAADARLAFLMGRLHRGQPGEQAIRELYGVTARQLDADVREWLKVR